MAGKETLPEGTLVRIVGGRLHGIAATVIEDKGSFVVVTFDDRAGNPVRRSVPRENVVVM
jgi:hypothetical protein